MFAHIFVTRFKSTLRSRSLMFWALLFPILLGTVFHVCFTNMGESEKFSVINIAVVNNAEYQSNTAFQTVLKSVSDKTKKSGNDHLFDITYCSKQKADSLLEDNKIDGYINSDSGIKLVIKKSGFKQTVMKEFLDEYKQTAKAYEIIGKDNPAALHKIANQNNQDFLKEVSQSNSKPDTTLNYYYALIAMACLFGSYFGLVEITAVQANQSPQGARVNMAPVHKLKVFGCSLVAVTLLHFINTCALIAYLAFALKINFGQKIGYVLLAAFASCLTGVMFGAMIGAVVKKREAVKQAVLTSVSLLLSFLSGLMVMNMKYLVTNALPFMAYVNPANLIDDAFYSLYCYDDNTRYFINIGLLGAFSALFFLIVYFVLRRQRYESL